LYTSHCSGGPCATSWGGGAFRISGYESKGPNCGTFRYTGGTGNFDTCQGTRKVPITFESCTGFINENLISIRIAQALAYSSTLISILSAVYEFFAKRELRKQARDRAENGDDAQITLDIEAAPAQIALLQLEVGSQKKTIDILKKRYNELKQLLISRRPAPPILPV
jgi:hypothetical protein